MLFLPLCASLLLIGVLPILPAVHSMELDELVMDFSFHVLTHKHLNRLLDTHDIELKQKLIEAKTIFEARRNAPNAPNDEQKHKFVSAMVEAMFNLSAKKKDMNFVPNIFKQWLKNAKKQELERKELLKEAAEDEWEFVHDDLALAKFNAFVMNNFPMGGGDVLKTIASSLQGKANPDGNRLVDVLVIFYKLCINLQQHGHQAGQSHQPAAIVVLDHHKAQWWLNLLAAHIEATMQAIEDEAEKRIADKGHHDQHHHDHTPHHQPPPLRNIDADVEGFMAQNPFLNDTVFAMFLGPEAQEQTAGSPADQQKTAGAVGVQQSLLGNIRDEWIKKPPMPVPKPELKPEPKPKAETKPEPKTELKPEPKPKAEPKAEPKQSDAQNLSDSDDWSDVDDYAKEQPMPKPMKIGGGAGGSQSHGQAPPSAAGEGGKTLSDSWTDVDDFAKEQPEPKSNPMPKKDDNVGQSSVRKSPSKRKDKNPGK